jgi:hypothetical protein
MKRQGLLLQRNSGRRKGRLHDGKAVVDALEPALVNSLEMTALMADDGALTIRGAIRS